MVGLTDRSEPVDLVTLKDELVRSDELDEVWARDQGTKAFGRPVAMAREGAIYDV